jgi:pimeloyl-ACP methyl ester carboxylesterase
MPITLTLTRPDIALVGTGSGDGPPALLLHAGGERRTVWAPIAAALARAGFSSAAFDLRGHGETERANADTLTAYGADVRAMVDTVEGTPVVVGSSLGGLAALLALADPELETRLAGLVLVDVVPDPQPDRTRRFLQSVGGGLADLPLVDDILGRAAALRDIARRLTLPTALVRGDRSALPDADVRRFTDLVPHAHVARIDGAGHLVARDAPAALAAHILAHLQRPDVRRRRIDRFLAQSGAATTDHPGGTLLAHLHRTGDTLATWGAPDWLVDAARVHAAYGTDGFPDTMVGASRDAITAVIGARGERFVARYCSCDRKASYPTFASDAPRTVDRGTGRPTPLSGPELRGFAELTIANELDVFAHAPDIDARHGAETAALFRTWLPLIGEPAREAVRTWVRARVSACASSCASSAVCTAGSS